MRWDIFIDEQKDGGRITAVGALCCEQGVTSQLGNILLSHYSKVRGSEKIKVGSIHWSAMGQIESSIAIKWIDDFARAPLAFFVRLDASPKATKLEMMERIIRFLAASERVPRGLEPANAILHFDAESHKDSDLAASLRRTLGLAGAYPLDDRATPLLQLVDLLLGISEAETSNRLEGVTSKSGMTKAAVLHHARSVLTEAASLGRRNAVVVLDEDGERFLFENS